MKNTQNSGISVSFPIFNTGYTSCMHAETGIKGIRSDELAIRNKILENVEAGAGSVGAGAMSLWFLFRCGQFGGMEQRRQSTAMHNKRNAIICTSF